MMVGLFVVYFISLFLILKNKSLAFFLIILNILLSLLLFFYEGTGNLRIQL